VGVTCVANPRFQFHKRRQLFIGTRDEAPSVAMGVHNPNRSSLKTNCWDPAQTPSGIVELIGDDFPISFRTFSRHCLLFNTSPNGSEQHAGNDSNASQEGFVERNSRINRRLCRAGRVFPL